MKIPYDWLKDYIDIDANIEAVGDKLALAGTEVVSYENNVLDVEILPNRGDCLCVKGVASEVSALYHKPIKQPKIEIKESAEDIKKLASVEVKDGDLCPRYMARVITGVKMGPSPGWMQKRLVAAGMRPINNIVDITNYVLLEMGQPLHAFDLDNIKGKKIIVRRAADGEKIRTLDDTERVLSKNQLVIADTERAVAIAGVMGGGNTEVSNSTVNILLESAFFEPVSINKTAKYLKLRTEASIRFERGVDFGNVETALDRAAALMAELAGGKVAKGTIDVKAYQMNRKELALRLARIRKVLGIEISKENVVKILQGLGFGIRDKGETLDITVPLNRAGDVEREIDLIEEIARIYGYDKIASTYPYIGSSTIDDSEALRSLSDENEVRETMAAAGFCEAKTYSMIGRKLVEKAGKTLDKAVAITNPLVEEMTHMRESLIPGLLEAAEYNWNRQMHDIALFETGKVFRGNGPAVKEKTLLGGVLCGSVFRGAVEKDRIVEDLYFVKGIIENVLSIFGAGSAGFRQSRDLLVIPGKSAEIFIGTDKIGFCGQAIPSVQENFGLNKPVFVFELDLDALGSFKAQAKTRPYTALPKFPSIRRDIAMYVPVEVTHDSIVSNVRFAGGGTVEDVSVFDKFSGKGKISLAYSVVYRDKNRTLTDEEVNGIHDKVVRQLVDELKVEIRK